MRIKREDQGIVDKTPERQLMIAMLQQAVEDLRFHGKDAVKSEEMRKDAECWIFNDEDEEHDCISIHRVCDHLNLSLEAVRQRAMEFLR